MRQFYETYMAFHSDYADAEAGIMTLWTFHTWAIESAYTTPYIMVTSPTAGSGKSTLFSVAEQIVRCPQTIIGATPAALYKLANGNTLLIDEADELQFSHPLKSILNAGYKHGAAVPRGQNGGVVMWPVFGPKMFAGISRDGRPLVSGATLDRCIQLPLRKQSAAEGMTTTRFLPPQAEPVASGLRGDLEDWADKAAHDLDGAAPSMPPELFNRAEELFSPLLAIADFIGGSWPQDARDWALQLHRARPTQADPNIQILADLKQVLDDHQGCRISTSELSRRRNELVDRDYAANLSTHDLGLRLAQLGIHPSPMRLGGKKSKSERAMHVRDSGQYTAEWADAFGRYL